MNRNLFANLGVVCLTGLLFSASAHANEVFPVVHTEPISVRVLDGKTGQPQPHVHLLLTAGYDRRDLALGIWREEVVTDAAGRASLFDPLRNLPLLRLQVRNSHTYSAPASAPWSVERIRLSGLSAVNRCGNFAVEEVPGVLTIYVKGNKSGPVPSQPSPVSPLVAAKATQAAPIPGPASIAPLTETEIDQLLSEKN